MLLPHVLQNPRFASGVEAYCVYVFEDESGGFMLAVGTPIFCGRSEPVNLRHRVHWHVPF
jgi:hypothetical protein